MGGDYAPDEIVAGALAAQREHGLTTLLTGPPARLRPVIARLGAGSELRVVPAEDVRGDGRGRPRRASGGPGRASPSPASSCGAARRARSSPPGRRARSWPAPGTGCLPLPGVPRPGLAVLLPTYPKPTVLIDAGATADPKPEMLVQFGHLGVAYAQIALGIPKPKVGLLTIGAEPGKGNALTRRAHELLTAEPQRRRAAAVLRGQHRGRRPDGGRGRRDRHRRVHRQRRAQDPGGRHPVRGGRAAHRAHQHQGRPTRRRAAAARPARARPPPGARDATAARRCSASAAPS